MAKVKIDSSLLERAKKAVEKAGYSSVEEFVAHAVEKELAQYETEEADDNAGNRFRGLGYLE
jgi:metal-responsive CopG/Arc/MetJ family transcriptional regulator